MCRSCRSKDCRRKRCCLESDSARRRRKTGQQILTDKFSITKPNRPQPNQSMMADESKYLVAEATPVEEVPQKDVGKWKSGLFRCFRYGICHKPLLCGIFTPTILMGQVSYCKSFYCWSNHGPWSALLTHTGTNSQSIMV